MGDETLITQARAVRTKLLARERELVQDLEIVRSRLQAVEGVIQSWGHDLSGNTPELQAADTVDRNVETSRVQRDVRKRMRGNSSKEDVARVARKILLENQSPMSRADLLGKLLENGLVINGKDPEAVLGTMLWRMSDSIELIRGKGYWPVGVEFPEE